MEQKALYLYLLFFTILVSMQSGAQPKAENLVIITLDGMRWQEVFGGADSALVNNKKYTKDSAGISKKFWDNNAVTRRKKLFPFVWSTLEQKGQLYGNRKYNNYVNVANHYQFSYPGYNEIFTGYPDTAVSSNNKIANPNINVLEYFNKQKNYAGKVAAFTTWDVFPYILNKERSGIYVNADVDTLKFNFPEFKLLNDLQFLSARPIDVRLDVLTYIAAREYMKKFAPKVLYIALDETDDYAHSGQYDQYLKSAHAADAMIADLWSYIQSSAQYKNKTTIVITCDHGRGDRIKDDWQGHGAKILESGETWIAAIGPGIKPLGEIKTGDQLYQSQLAATFAQLLGLTFTANHPVAAPIKTILRPLSSKTSGLK